VIEKPRAASAASNNPNTQYVECFRDGNIDYLKVTDPNEDIYELKQRHIENMQDSIYRAQYE